MWLKLVELALGIAAAVLGWLEARRKGAEDAAGHETAQALQQAGADAQAAAQTSEILDEVRRADDARLQHELGIGRKPDSLWDPDEFTIRRPPGAVPGRGDDQGG